MTHPRWIAFLLSASLFFASTGTAQAQLGKVSIDSKATAPVERIWPRLVAGMQLGGEQRPEVQRFIQHYRANPAYFTAMLARAEPFLWLILQATEQRLQPTELALLPAVESSWDPHAVSVSSAYGLWQFIPKTGHAYGLRNALNYDARRDPVASTRAALDLLAELHREYRDWPLALAAYNTGGVRLKKTIKARKSRDFWQLPLPSVTKNYVPRLLAIAALVRNPERHGVTLPAIAAAPVAEIIALDHETPLLQALHAAGVDHNVVRTFNPGMRASDAPTQSPTLLLPRADAIAVMAELAFLRPGAPSTKPSDPKPIPPTADTPNGTDRQLAGALSEPVMPSIAALASLAGQMHWDEQISSINKTAGLPTDPTHHEVRDGDTLFFIAQQHGISVAHLKRLNPEVTNNVLRAGQTIKLNQCARRGCG